MPASGDTASVPLFAHVDARALNRAPHAEPTATATNFATRTVGAEELSSPVAFFGSLTTAPPLGATQSAAVASASCTPQVHPAGRVASEMTADSFAGFHPFRPPAALPQLSPMASPEDDDGGTGGASQPGEPRRRCDRGSTDSFTRDSPSFDGCDTEENDGLETSPLWQPSPHAIATAFTPLRQGGKIERTKELMERVALVKARFRAQQLAAATGQCQEQRE